MKNRAIAKINKIIKKDFFIFRSEKEMCELFGKSTHHSICNNHNRISKSIEHMLDKVRFSQKSFMSGEMCGLTGTITPVYR